MVMRDPTRRVTRWLLMLGEYCFTAVYPQGKLNFVPDALSRLPSANETLPAVTFTGTGPINLNNFLGQDYQDGGFEFPTVTLPNCATISSISLTQSMPITPGPHEWAASILPLHLQDLSVASTRSGVWFNPLQEEDSISSSRTNSYSASDALAELIILPPIPPLFRSWRTRLHIHRRLRKAHRSPFPWLRRKRSIRYIRCLVWWIIQPNDRI